MNDSIGCGQHWENVNLGGFIGQQTGIIHVSLYHYVARSRQSLIVRRRGRHCNLDIDMFHASQQVNNFSR